MGSGVSGSGVIGGNGGMEKVKTAFTYLFQWVLEFLYKLGKMMGIIAEELSLTRLMMYSLFQ